MKRESGSFVAAHEQERTVSLAERGGAPPADGPQPGDVLAGKYLVEHVLGRGGMGIVVAAKHLQLGERVAVKLLDAGGGGEAGARFLREARAAARIKSDRVVRLMDLGTLESGEPYIVMEHLEGEDLGAVVGSRAPVAVDEAADCVLQACAAMAEAHRLGIIHRDLKPSNLFMTRDSTGARLVKVLDFGIAKAALDERADDAGPGLTATRTFLGSPAYASPEQLSCARDVDARTDVWSLGVILYELLTAKRPFAGGSPSAVLAAIAERPEPPLRHERPEIPPALEALVRGCLESDLERRVSSVGALARRLAPFAPRVSRALAGRASEVLGEPGTPVAPETDTDMTNEAQTLVAGRFRLVGELRRGGMGSVWLAHNIALDVPCAVKFIEGTMADDPTMRARFEREAKAAAQLRSPHVVQIYDHGIWEDKPYIAMELLEGEDLGQRLERVGRLSAEQTVTVVEQVVRALARAHAAGIVHRDLKPDNVFLTRDDDREIAKVLDFGIAKTARIGELHSKTATGALLGTPYYMSPEQADGTRPVDFRSDLWSLGVIAFQCVTGRLPFESEALGDLLNRIMNKPIPVPSAVAPDVPAAFDGWFARACARPVDQRFTGAREMADALAEALGVPRSSGERLGAGAKGHEATPVPGSELAATQPAEVVLGRAISAAPTFDGQSRPPAPSSPPRARRLVPVLAVVAGLAAAGALVFGLAGPRARTGEVRGSSPEVPRSSPSQPAPTQAGLPSSSGPTEGPTAAASVVPNEPTVLPAAPATARVDTPQASPSASALLPPSTAAARRLQPAPSARPSSAPSAPKVPVPKPPASDDPGY
jgi:serine/threonine-protein kinase